MKFTVDANHDGVLLRSYLKGTCAVSARLLIRLKQTDGGICVNGVPSTVRKILHTGDEVEIACGETPAGSLFAPEDTRVRILFEDGDVLAVSKPPFMPTHTSVRHYEGTLANALTGMFRERGEAFVFRPVNRLDRNTSGIVLLGKNQYSASLLCRAMKRHEISKTYYALTDGFLPEPSGRMDGWIRRRTEGIVIREICGQNDPGAEEVRLSYEVIVSSLAGADEPHSFVRLMPETGRTHQLRVQLASAGCPVTGDGLYGQDSVRIPRQALHAGVLKWKHPVTGETVVTEDPLPDDFRACCRALFPDFDFSKF